MNITSKSPAERVSQFANLPPDTIELPEADFSRYCDAYATLTASINDGNSNEAVVQTLEHIETANEDVITGRGIYSYASYLRMQRLAEETAFAATLNSLPFKQQPDHIIAENADFLRNNTIDLTDTNKERVQKFFPSGNYFLHSTISERIINILDSGSIQSTVGFATHEERMDRSNGGSLGVSGNYNDTPNLLGDARHLAGFITDPLLVLQNQGGYFSVPSKSCWHELQYYGDDPTDIMDIREIETQYNLTANLFHEYEMWSAAIFDVNVPLETRLEIEMEYATAMSYVKSHPDVAERAYRIDRQGQFWFTEMLGNDGEPLNPTAVVLYAAQKGSFGSEIAKALRDIQPDRLNPAVLRTLGLLAEHIGMNLDTLMDTEGKRFAKNSKIDVENTYFYCPKRDLNKWLPVLSTAPHQPKGIITYDNQQVRVPTAFGLRLPDPGSDSLRSQLSIISNSSTVNWNALFADPAVQSPFTPFLIRPREANLAGVLTLESRSLSTKSFDEIYE